MAWVESVTNSLMYKYGAPILIYRYLYGAMGKLQRNSAYVHVPCREV